MLERNNALSEKCLRCYSISNPQNLLRLARRLSLRRATGLITCDDVAEADKHLPDAGVQVFDNRRSRNIMQVGEHRCSW